MAPRHIPTELKRAKGNPGQRPLPEIVNVAPAPSVIPDPPKNLGQTGSATWERLWDYQLKMHHPWITESERLLVERYCQGQDEREFYLATIAKDGRFTEGSNGQPVLHPAVRALRTLDDQLTKWEGLLGLTPSDRARLGLAEITAASKLQLLQEGRAKTAKKGD